MARATKPKPDPTPAAPPAQETLAGQDTPAAQDTLAGQDTPAAQVVTAAVLSIVDEVPVVQVRGPAKGRWRIGRKFTPEVTEIPVAELTEDQFAALMADPELTVTGAFVAPAA